jgi:hypothetical protein
VIIVEIMKIILLIKLKKKIKKEKINDWIKIKNQISL